MSAVPLDLHQNDLQGKPVHCDQYMIQFLILNTIQKVLYCFQFCLICGCCYGIQICTCCLLCFAAYRIKTSVVSVSIQSPDMKNQTFTPTFSAIGLLKSNPTGIGTEEIKVSTEKARPIFLGATVSCIYAVNGIV